MINTIDKIDPVEFPEVVEVWEASVRATHHFLKEEDILFFKPLILKEYLKAVDLACIRNQSGKILGFMGVAEGNLEMLFIHPDARGKGIGKTLTQHAIRQMQVTKVDVNEDNGQAIGFYEHMGFQTVGRSELDGAGKPYPLLHMALKATH
ncbi:acetyltransferase [Rapidithrix thailandica]|uniref:Acetyltransferase n=1 Tax=Rapidithrix thailandica TaxID=413964 RepID=A0AAW9S5C7_9BACT